MKIALLTKYGDTLPVLGRFVNEGHEARVWTKDRAYAKAWDGLVEKLPTVDSIVAWKPELVVIGENGLVSEANQLRGAGLLTYGGLAISTELEDDRAFACYLAEKCGITVPDTVEFKDPKKGIEFLRDAKERYIVKYLGEEDKITSFMGKSNDDVAAFMESKPPKHGFILQRFVESSFEFNVEVWFCFGEPIPGSTNGTMEQKKLMSGDYGPNTGCMSSLCWSWPDDAPIAKDIFGKGLFKWLKDQKYTGSIDVALIAAKNGTPNFLEFTPRFGLSALFNLIHTLRSDFGELLRDHASGTPSPMKLSGQYTISPTCSIPPYPYEIEKMHLEGQEIDLPPVPDNVSVWLQDVLYEDQKLQSAGTVGLIGYIVASSEDPAQAQKDALNYVGEMKKSISQLQARTDAGEQYKHLEDLKELGYGS